MLTGWASEIDGSADGVGGIGVGDPVGWGVWVGVGEGVGGGGVGEGLGVQVGILERETPPMVAVAVSGGRGVVEDGPGSMLLKS